MSKLKGHSSLSINNAPQPKPEPQKLGLIDNVRVQMRSYKLSLEAIAALEEMQERLSAEARIKLSMSKILELIIFTTEKMKFEQFLPKK